MSLIRAYPISDSLIGAGWTNTYAEIDDVYGAWDGVNNVCTSVAASSRRCGITTITGTTSISNVRLCVRLRRTGGTFAGQQFRPYLFIGGVAYYYNAAWQNAPFDITIFAGDYAVNPATSGAWTQAALNAGVLISVEGQNCASGMRLDAMWAEISALATPVQIEPVRDLGSRRLFMFRRPRTVLNSLEVPLDVGLDVAPMDLLPVTHFAGPHDSAPGWLQKPWQARLTRVRKVTIGSGQGGGIKTTVDVLELRRLLALYRDTAWSKISSAPVTADGISRISKGVARAFTRSSVAYVKDGGSGEYTVVQADQEQHGDTGDLYEGAATNLLQYSGFSVGDVTGWTKAGTGSNGSAIAADSGDPYALWNLDSTGVSQCVTFTAGNPIHVADLKLTGTATGNVAANTKCTLAVYRRDEDPTKPLYVALQRGVDSKYFRASDQTWQVGIQWNPMTGGSATAVTAWVSPVIDVGVSLTTLTPILGIPTATGVAGQINHAYGIQLEANTWASSPILTTNATVTRAASRLLVTNNTGQRSWNAAQGAFCFEFIPEWSSANLAAGVKKTIVYVSHDANNYYRAYFDQTANAVKFEVKWQGTLATATGPVGAIVAGTVYQGGVRWTGAAAELDLTAYTIDVFVNGVKGTSAVAGAVAEASPCNLEVGSAGAATDNFDGVIRMQTSLQWVPTDIEMARLP